ncbi:MAG TPA: lamin tail domain-containing protein, partial [Herpetosiphonaceae bacterium]
ASPSPSPSQLPTFDNCRDDDGAKNAPNFPVRIEWVDKDEEIVYLKNLSDAPIDITGWHMCSFRGAQEHPGISGTLPPHQTILFPNTGGNIWNNDDKDDGALYNASGQAISYWNDLNR